MERKLTNSQKQMVNTQEVDMLTAENEQLKKNGKELRLRLKMAEDSHREMQSQLDEIQEKYNGTKLQL